MLPETTEVAWKIEFLISDKDSSIASFSLISSPSVIFIGIAAILNDMTGKSGPASISVELEEAVVGHHAMERLENELARKGLRVLWQQHGSLPAAGGNGGAGKVNGTACVPIDWGDQNKWRTSCDSVARWGGPMSWLESVGAVGGLQAQRTHFG